MNEEFEKRKTILEIDAQKIISYDNVVVITFISILLTIWLSKEMIIDEFVWKMVVTSSALVVFIILMAILYDKLNQVKDKIKNLNVIN